MTGEITVERMKRAITCSIENIFRTMLNMEIVPADDGRATVFMISGIVGISGGVNGYVAVRSSSRLAARIASAMFASEYDNITTEVKDAIGEITNMVAGNIKSHLDGAGDLFNLSPPSVVVGNHELYAGGRGIVIGETFIVHDDTLGVEVFLQLLEQRGEGGPS